MFSAFKNFLKNVRNAYKLKIWFVKDDCTRDGHADMVACAYMGQFLQGGNFLHPLTTNKRLTFILGVVTRMLYLKKNVTQSGQKSLPAEIDPYM